MTRPTARKTAVDANHKALELVMRDVLGGLEELATLAGYEAAPGSIEILSIERPATSPHSPDSGRPHPSVPSCRRRLPISLRLVPCADLGLPSPEKPSLNLA
ncbi:MAG: hypothetical protein WC383_01925 [Gammaproteobacteria bacterium]